MTLDEAVQLVIIDKLKKKIVDNDMVATGELLKSVRFEKKEVLGLTTIEIYSLNYIVGLDEGVSPGTIPDISMLQSWIDAKGLELNPFAVRANIIKFGTSWYKQGGSHIVTDTINDEAFKEILSLSSQDLKLKIKEQWQLLFRNNR